MLARKRNWKSIRPTSLSEAFELCVEHAATVRRPIKVMADLMGVESKTLYRWLSETSMPLNRIRQFEAFSGVSFISEYLCLAHGNKVVIEIPLGKKASVIDLAEVQASFAEAMTLLVRFYQQGEAEEITVSALSRALEQLAYQRENVLKSGSPELELFGD
ncbi:hypothetical protein [Paludibacterium yongneupense]|uniref:hypothetical protein n=1 Tax=Paludibacterium yongneupense TaxID=400061 RepID=UPI00048CDB32|nr:hypothetical protein [Paludibacterium yongneupense]